MTAKSAPLIRKTKTTSIHASGPLKCKLVKRKAILSLNAFVKRRTEEILLVWQTIVPTNNMPSQCDLERLFEGAVVAFTAVHQGSTEISFFQTELNSFLEIILLQYMQGYCGILSPVVAVSTPLENNTEYSSLFDEFDVDCDLFEDFCEVLNSL
jgi:hypothetical protein